MRSEAVKTVVKLLKKNPQVSDYKVNVSKKESYELFFVKGKLETVRSTDTCDRQITVYADHDGFRGDASFYVYPADAYPDLKQKTADAVRSALLVSNAPYTLPDAEEEETEIPSNLNRENVSALAERISGAVFAANTLENGSLNSVEIFLNHHTDCVKNSRGLNKSQSRWTAMVEAIPTYNGEKDSVELYEQYNFSALSIDALMAEIYGKMTAVKARYDAVKPDFSMDCPVVLHKQELNDLFSEIAGDLNYSTVYSHSNLFQKGDAIQKDRTGDPITIRMKGSSEGNVMSSAFDSDGMSLGEITLVSQGTAENYYGSNRFGQYLGETPTGSLRCLCVEPGTADEECLQGKPWLEVISMSGLQVDFFNDYIGGEIRLAYYHNGREILPVTGISISGKLGEALSSVRLSKETASHDGYTGPAEAIFSTFKIF